MLQGTCYISFSVIDATVCCENLGEEVGLHFFFKLCMYDINLFIFTKDTVKNKSSIINQRDNG